MTQVMRNESRIKKKNAQRYPYSIVIDFYPRALSKLGATRCNGETGNGTMVQWYEK